jgi:hypothetical protein
MNQPKYLSAIRFSALPLFLALLTPTGVALSQNTNVAPKSQQSSPSSNWSKFSNISQKFMQGCMGSQSLLPSEKRIRQNYCQCALNAYQVRYTPELFSEINTYVVKIGKDAPVLVNLMMNPELNQCAIQTGYKGNKT